jgi:hypothetical protein
MPGRPGVGRVLCAAFLVAAASDAAPAEPTLSHDWGTAPEPAQPARAAVQDYRAASNPLECIPREQCCRLCDKGRACGNSCISADKNCHKGRGCACHVDEVCADVAAERFFERAMELGSVQLVEHFRRGDNDDALGGVAGLVGERAGEKGLSCPGHRVDVSVEADPVGLRDAGRLEIVGVERREIQWFEQRPLLVLEGERRDFSGDLMHAMIGEFVAPREGLSIEIEQIGKAAAGPEAIAEKTDRSFDAAFFVGALDVAGRHGEAAAGPGNTRESER